MKKQIFTLILGSAILSTSPAFAMETDELHHDPSTIRVTATTHFEHDGNEKPIKRITEMSEKELQDAGELEKDQPRGGSKGFLFAGQIYYDFKGGDGQTVFTGRTD